MCQEVMWVVTGLSQTWIQDPESLLSSGALGPWGRQPAFLGLGFLSGQHCLSAGVRGQHTFDL